MSRDDGHAHTANQSTTEIRVGTPTAKEAEAFAELALAAGGEIFAEAFGPRANETLRKLYRLDRNFMSHELTLFLWEGDEIAGMFSGYSSTEKKQIFASNLWKFLRTSPLSLPRMIWKSMTLSNVLSFSEQLGDGEFCVSFLAIKPQMRGRGLSRLLLSRGAEVAREKGSKTLMLCVEVDNDVAVNAYRRWGMEVVETSKPQAKPSGDGEWTMHRMIKPLS
ncbi:MAG: N-acetyltransferase [Myxococcota bacterium]